MPLLITAASGQQGQPSRGLKKASSSKVKVRNQSTEYTAEEREEKTEGHCGGWWLCIYYPTMTAVLPSKIKHPPLFTVQEQTPVQTCCVLSALCTGSLWTTSTSPAGRLVSAAAEPWPVRSRTASAALRPGWRRAPRPRRAADRSSWPSP